MFLFDAFFNFLCQKIAACRVDNSVLRAQLVDFQVDYGVAELTEVRSINLTVYICYNPDYGS